ncbi:hypothetical protein EON81_14830 [bacterium]|nr:MAG: hypothetical protein EON81_14830 [bacterium]
MILKQGMKIVLALAGTTAFAQAGQTFRPMSGIYGPYLDLSVSRPKVRLEIWAPDGRDVTVAEMKVDDRVVEAQYKKSARALEYIPEASLAPGEHVIQCRVGFKGTPVYKTGWKFRVLPNAMADLPAPTKEQDEALAILNQYRKGMGLPDFVSDRVLNFAAAKHANYCSTHDVIGHEQVPGKEGFMGVSSFERLSCLGWIGQSFEGVTHGESDIEEAVSSLFDSPYHRLPFLQPGIVPFGAGRVGDKMTVEIGTGNTEGFTVSPGPGQTDVPTKWDRLETPDPLRFHKGHEVPTGYPIVVSLFGEERNLKGVQAEVQLAGKPVAIFLNTPQNDSELTAAAFLIPQKPLKPGATYDVSVQGTDEKGNAVVKRWSFTTAKE